MALGHDYKQDSSNSFVIVGPADTFSSGDQFAYVINLDQGIGTTQAKLVLAKENGGGSESVVDSIPMSIADPNDNEFANKIAMSDLMYGQAPGKYKLELQTDTQVLASETFTYIG